MTASVNTSAATLSIALAGNPNCGKTTLFNALTGLRQKVGNYPGVTVEKKSGIFRVGEQTCRIVDLPGTYSLSPRAADEKIAHDFLLGKISGEARPDVVVCVVDASNLERNLFFASQILDLGMPTILALNMMDMVERSGATIDLIRLQESIGVPVVPMVASRGEGIEALRRALAEGRAHAARRIWKPPDEVEQAVAEVAGTLCAEGFSPAAAFSEALFLLEGEISWEVPESSAADRAAEMRERLDVSRGDWRAEVIEARYEWIRRVVQYSVRHTSSDSRSLSDRVDAIATHPVWGWLLFTTVMGAMFFVIFSVAAYPMDWIDGVFASTADVVRSGIPAGAFRDLLVDGVIAGVGSVVIFLPQILCLFFFIGLLEDSGYMPRAAFIMDRIMSRVGLHGKSFIPLLSSFACAIPGVMATRTIESHKDRLVTILVAPLMSCSARLPVYAIMIAMLLPTTPAWQKAGLMLSMYALGMVAAFGMAWLFKKTLLRSETQGLIMELPPYRRPSVRATALRMWERGGIFLKKAGTTILLLSIVIWGMMTYPAVPGASPEESIRQSIAGQVGRAIEPVIEPLGFDWRVGIGLVGAFAAREVFVSTMGIVFNIETADESSTTLLDAFRSARWPDGRPLFTPLVALNVMIFFVLAMQCISTIAVVRRETNSWRWPLFQVAYMNALAWTVSFLVYQIGSMAGWA